MTRRRLVSLLAGRFELAACADRPAVPALTATVLDLPAVLDHASIAGLGGHSDQGHDGLLAAGPQAGGPARRHRHGRARRRVGSRPGRRQRPRHQADPAAGHRHVDRLHRPSRPADLRAVADGHAAGERGMVQVCWDVDTEDRGNRDVGSTTRRLLHGARPGSIVLMDDVDATTGQAVLGVIDARRAPGRTLVAVPELLGHTPPGEAYSHP